MLAMAGRASPRSRPSARRSRSRPAEGARLATKAFRTPLRPTRRHRRRRTTQRTARPPLQARRARRQGRPRRANLNPALAPAAQARARAANAPTPTLRQTHRRDWPDGAMRVQKVDVQCVLQITLLLALSCVLHRLASRVIHRRESFPMRLLVSLRSFVLTTFAHKCGRRARTLSPPRAPDQLAQLSHCAASPQASGQGRLRDAPCPGRAALVRCAASLAAHRSGNDPSAGSPTETLLRLLLPLNDQV